MYVIMLINLLHLTYYYNKHHMFTKIKIIIISVTVLLSLLLLIAKIGYGDSQMKLIS